MEFSFIEACCWFFGGAFVFMLLARLIRYSQMVNFINVILIQCLKLLGTISSDISFAKQIKYDTLKKSNMSENDIENIIKIDEKAFHNWKATTITLFLLTFPKKYAGMLSFYDWDSAMKVLDDIYKKEKKYRSQNE